MRQGDGVAILVTATTAKDQRRPAPTALSNDGAIAAWTAQNDDGDDDGIFAIELTGEADPTRHWTSALTQG